MRRADIIGRLSYQGSAGCDHAAQAAVTLIERLIRENRRLKKLLKAKRA